MEITKEQMYQWYVVEKLSYRKIMAHLGINNARKVKQLLEGFGIEIRKGSEAIKVQWENNSERRENQAKRFSKALAGKSSEKRLSKEQLVEKAEAVGAKLLECEVLKGLTHMWLECVDCEHTWSVTLKNVYGCKLCSRAKTAKEQRLPFEVVERTFSEQGLVLQDLDAYENQNTKLAFICKKHEFVGLQHRSHASARLRHACRQCRNEIARKEKGITVSQRRALHTELQTWRQLVFARDGYICQCCGYDKGKILRAHHILNFAKYEHLRLAVDNGITLCKNCHDPQIKGSFHSVYGVRDNNEQQLLEYIELKKSRA